MAINVDAMSSVMRTGAPAASSKPAPAVPAGQAAAANQAAPAPAVSQPQDIEAVVAQLNRMLQSINNSLQFEVDRATGKTVVRVLDSKTNEVLRQFPSEEVLAIARTLESAKGALFNDQA